MAAIDPDELREVWFDARLTVDEIAKRLGIHRTTVGYHARQLGLPRRKRGPKRAGASAVVTGQAAAPAIALTGGRWVPNGRGVMVWRPHGG